MAKRKIIDAHHHLWDLDHGYAYPWLQDKPAGEGMLGDLSSIARTHLPADYFADAANYDVVKTVHIEAVPIDPLAETRWLLALGERIPNGLVGFAALNDPTVEKRLAEQAAFPAIRGVRQIVNWHKDPRFSFTPSDLLADSAWQAGYGLLKKYRLSFDLQLYPGQMAEAYDLARRHPETLIVINHTGMPIDRDPENLALWRQGMQKLATADNVVAKISGLGMVEHDWSTDSIRPFVLGTIDAFGSERCMFGSNWPVDKLYSSFDTLYGAFESIVSDFTSAEQDRLFRANAERWYRL